MKLTFNLAQHGYDIVIKNGVLGYVGKHINLGGRVLLLCDDNLSTKYINILAKQCANIHTLKLSADAKNKNMDTVRAVLESIQAAQLTKDDVIIALGGNFVCHVAGFAAKLWLGGTKLCLLPTTLAAQIGSAVNGLHNLNLQGQQNALVLTHKPCFVGIDPATLKTLSPRQIADGMAYSLSAALSVDPALVSILEEEDCKENLERIVTLTLLCKKQLIDQDETFCGQVRLLNFGRTVGAAISSAAGPGALLPGEALALGMLPLIESRSLLQRTKKLMRRLGLPTKAPCTAQEIIANLRAAAYSQGDMLQLVRVKKAGHGYFETLPREELELLIEDTFA